MYQYIRLRNESAGFRLVKLRAEARFYEASRTIAIVNALVIIIILIEVLIWDKNFISYYEFHYWLWFIHLNINVIIAWLFYLQEKPAWKRYYGNITTIYLILLHEGNKFNSKSKIIIQNTQSENTFEDGIIYKRNL